MGKLGQGVSLLHELGQLAAAEELTDNRHHRADVDQSHGGDLLWVADAHAFLHHPLHAPEPDTQLVLDKLAHGLNPSVAQVVYVIGLFHPVVDADHALHQLDQVFLGDGTPLKRYIQAKSLIKFIAPHLLQIVTVRVKELGLQIFPGVVKI